MPVRCFPGVPKVRTNPLMVDEGGQCLLVPEHLLLMDMDSGLEDLRLLLRSGPRHGSLELQGSPLAEGHALSLQDLRSRELR